MVNKSKAIGTAGETAVVKYLAANGFGLAERRALRGAADVGDVLVCPGVIAEVKAGEKAKNFRQSQLERWMDETRKERGNAGADLALLVVQRRDYGGPNAGWWWTWMTPLPLPEITAVDGWQAWWPLSDAVRWLRGQGWGDPL